MNVALGYNLQQQVVEEYFYSSYFWGGDYYTVKYLRHGLSLRLGFEF